MKLKSGGSGAQTETNKGDADEDTNQNDVEPTATQVEEAQVAAVVAEAITQAKPKTVKNHDKDYVPGGEGIDEPTEFDVLNGRGASVNAHKGNQRFRALCFQRKPLFEAGNHAAKRRIATEIVGATTALSGRFLKKREKNGPWYQLTTEKSILKACQVMRDFERPDRVGLREMARLNAKKRNRVKPPSTPMPDTQAPPLPAEPIVENPFGVHDHDVLSGRGAYVNGHVGNQRFRKLALERKTQFEAGSYSEKRALASDIVSIIRGLDPPGRFLRRASKQKEETPTDDQGEPVKPEGLDDSWEELTGDKAIHKACQVMRDIDRPDRGPDRRQSSRKASEKPDTDTAVTHTATTTTAAATTVAEVVAAAEAAFDTVMDGVVSTAPPASANTSEEAVKEDKVALAEEPAETAEI